MDKNDKVDAAGGSRASSKLTPVRIPTLVRWLVDKKVQILDLDVFYKDNPAFKRGDYQRNLVLLVHDLLRYKALRQLSNRTFEVRLDQLRSIYKI